MHKIYFALVCTKVDHCQTACSLLLARAPRPTSDGHDIVQFLRHIGVQVLWGLMYASLLGPIIFEAACQLEIKCAEMQNSEPDKELDLPYPAVAVKELPFTAHDVSPDQIEIGTAARVGSFTPHRALAMHRIF